MAIRDNHRLARDLAARLRAEIESLPPGHPAHRELARHDAAEARREAAERAEAEERAAFAAESAAADARSADLRRRVAELERKMNERREPPSCAS